MKPQGIKTGMSAYRDNCRIKTIEVAGDIYENVTVSDINDLIYAINEQKVIAIHENGKEIYVNGSYIVSFTKYEE